MDRSSVGISGQHARSGNGCNQPGNHTASSKRGQHRHATVRQSNNSPPHCPGA
ncbi:hypothetical protein [Endozoicomonas sp. GU-1]|uniref:hypothetical protein n=1 Tax=Endozoicomonas sp. GU-1 TaxID=3009078 RepID=UPI0022B574FB|nr:hypothetical protein [Endozoicomonas sp. GU-1]WBA79329.1 hypothetical protein O2T12_13135 [Endozoicomonas sp. GU-1]WBA86970.1 hypothetical protein O3276_02695 [Endozoicomonas sp. GU-1]